MGRPSDKQKRGANAPQRTASATAKAGKQGAGKRSSGDADAASDAVALNSLVASASFQTLVVIVISILMFAAFYLWELNETARMDTFERVCVTRDATHVHVLAQLPSCDI